ncbi:L-asparaginase 1 [Actinomyces bovis]|uniref:L-asparaginase 1 n=1 Tax=Actinomyces bovis TaxID=1658 RepID=A0ABY1VQ46_9ACTO|nr:asparaginase [Actinomyces bovis]SPT54258.1 L-asparaginase 1 [Actinomyces bovis]VEG56438.1 L-asparaginase 1 [Actinomyces israelii]
MRVHITYTGGTIGMVDSPHGLVPGTDLPGWLAEQLQGTGLEGATITSLEPLIDSANATPDSWQAIITDLRQRADTADAFVVLHGTDTMAYTAAALSYALTDLPQPVVITGSQLPQGVMGSDASSNVMGALQAATSGRVKGVSLFFGQELLVGNRATKTSSWAYAGFISPAVPPLAVVGAPWRWSPEAVSADPAAAGATGPWEAAKSREEAPSGRSAPQPYARHDVVVVDLVPGISAKRLEALLTPTPEAVVLRAYGVGNVPAAEPGLAQVVEQAVSDGVAVVVASQCQQAEVLLGHYEAGDAVAQAGAVGSGDMTLEALYAKLQFLLAQGLRGAELAAAVAVPLAGELSPAS